MIDDAVRSILLADPTVYGLVSTRIFPNSLPLRCTFPAISYSFPSDPYKRVARAARCQVDCWAETLLGCKNLKNAVETALDGYSGTMNSVNIEIITPLSCYDMPVDETGLYHIPYDFKILYRHGA